MYKSIFFILCSFIAINSGIAQINLEDGLVAYYPFESNGLDQSEYDNHAIDLMEVQLIDGCDDVEQSAYYFNGINSFIEFPHNTAIDFGTSDLFSISIWLKIPGEQIDLDGTINDILEKWTNHAEIPYPFGLRYFNSTSSYPGQIWFGRFDTDFSGCNNSPFLISTVTVNDNKWHNVIVQRNGDGQIDLYIDGVLDGSVLDNTVCSVQNTDHLLLGARLTGQPFRQFLGGMDNLRIYNRLLTADEIDYINNKGLSAAKEISDSPAISIFPNPSKGNEINISYAGNEKITKISLYDISGKLIQVYPGTHSIVLPALITGTYFLNIQFEKQNIIQKIIID